MEWAAAVVALGTSADAYFVWQVSLHILSDATLVASAVMKTVKISIDGNDAYRERERERERGRERDRQTERQRERES